MNFDLHKIERMTNIELYKLYMNIWKYRHNNPAKFVTNKTTRHHFQPKSWGDETSLNYIRITDEEHFVCHYILYGGKMTSSFSFVCYKQYKRKEKLPLNDLYNLFEQEKTKIKQHLSENVKGEKNNSFGKFGKEHPTSKFDKSGKNNPNFGKSATDYCKNQCSKANSGMVTAINIDTNEVYGVTKDEFDKNDNLKGHSHDKTIAQTKNKLTCYDKIDKICKKIPLTDYKSNDKYIAVTSNEYKRIKLEN